MFGSNRAAASRAIASGRSLRHRAAASLVAGTVVWLAVFSWGSPAAACELTDPLCVVDDVKDTAEQTVDDVQEEANETIDDVQKTADETITRVEETVDEVVNPGGGGTGPAPNPPTEPTVPGNPNNPGNDPKGNSKDNPTGGPNKSDRPGRTRGSDRPVAAAVLLPEIADALGPLVRDLNDPAPDEPGLGESAVDALQDFAFPLILAIMVGVFLTIQHRVDRKDPKLLFAPIDHDPLSFE